MEKLNGIKKPLHDVLPDLLDVPDESIESAPDDSSASQHSALASKIDSQLQSNSR